MNEQTGNPQNPYPEGTNQEVNLAGSTSDLDSPVPPSQGESPAPAHPDAASVPVQDQVPTEPSVTTSAPPPPPGSEVSVAPGQPVQPYGQQEQVYQPGQYQQAPGGQQTAQYPHAPQSPQPGQYPQTPMGQQLGQYSQAPYGQQPPMPQSPYASQGVSPSSGGGKAVGALVCGILAILFSSTVIPSIILGIVAIILASKHVKSLGKDGKATAGKICGIAGIVLSVLALVIYLSTGLFISKVVTEELDKSSSFMEEIYSDSKKSTTTPNISDSISSANSEVQLEAAMEETLVRMASPDAATIKEIAEEYDEYFTLGFGVSMEEAGIDSIKITEDVLATLEYEIDATYDYYDGTGVGYAYFYMINIYEVYLTTYDSLDYTADLTAEDVGAAFNKAFAEAKQSAGYLLLEFEKKDDVWQVVESSYEEEAEYLYGTF